MASDDLIAAYLIELRMSLGSLGDKEMVLEEAADHLSESVEHLIAQGVAPAEAMSLALARFGSASLITKVCKTESRKGAAVSTTFTRRAGLAAALAPFLLLFGAGGNAYFESNDGFNGQLHGLAVVCVVVGVVAFILGMFGLGVRHRGLGRFGKAALILMMLSPFLAAPFTWGAGGVFLLLTGVAVTLLAIGMLRAGALPVIPVVILGLAPLMGIGFYAAGALTGGNPIDEHTWFFALPIGLMVGAMGWLGWYQWNEPALDRPAGSAPLASA